MDIDDIQTLFERYQRFFMKGLRGDADMEQVASSYATAFIASAPAGVMAGENNAEFGEMMRQGFEHYRRIGTKAMHLGQVEITPIDPLHCLARVAWTATYDRGAEPEITIDFDVHYLLRQGDGGPEIFGWITGDEQAVLQAHGIV